MICSKCKIEKDFAFDKHRRRISGYTSECKDCRREYRKCKKDDIETYNSSYWSKHKNYLVAKRKKIYDRRKRRLYYEKNKKKILIQTKEYQKKRSEIDLLYRLRSRISSTIRKSLRRVGKKCKTSESILGCAIPVFKRYLESKFESWMSWDNYGHKNGYPNKIKVSWDIDHIIPMASAKTEKELIKLNHYSNLRPLDSYVNRFIKRGRYEKKDN